MTERMRRWSGKALHDPRRFSRIGRRAVPAHDVKDWPNCPGCVSCLSVADKAGATPMPSGGE